MINCFVVKPYSENMYLYHDGTEGAVVDPGGDVDVVLGYCKENSITVTKILLTHGHFDHIMGVLRLAEATGAKIYAHVDEAAVLSEPDMNFSTYDRGGPVSITPNELLRDGQQIAVGSLVLRVIHTPAHTPGCVCFYDEQQGILISGDTLFFESVGRTDFPYSQPQLMKESLNKLFRLPDSTKVYPGHGSPTTILHEKRVWV